MTHQLVGHYISLPEKQRIEDEEGKVKWQCRKSASSRAGIYHCPTNQNRDYAMLSHFTYAPKFVLTANGYNAYILSVLIKIAVSLQ